jgi:hypothetical protein
MIGIPGIVMRDGASKRQSVRWSATESKQKAYDRAK